MGQAAAPEIVRALRQLGLGSPRAMRPLSGGVSSDIWWVDLPDGPVAAKRALPRLKVAAVWEAPVERSRYEAAWLRVAGEHVPGLAPRLVGFDPTEGVVVMEWLDPKEHPVWKSLLRDGDADPEVAARLGAGLGALHAATAGSAETAAEFDNAAIFSAIRLEPYLDATASAHPAQAERIAELRFSVETHRYALVHGDVSPKNVLVGPAGPVLVDAECATWSDPAFDLAFCLNHLLLKCLWNPGARAAFLACYDAMCTYYMPHVTWEPQRDIEARASALLPALLLARVDGKSPVEYLNRQSQSTVREAALEMLHEQPTQLGAIRERWQA